MSGRARGVLPDRSGQLAAACGVSPQRSSTRWRPGGDRAPAARATGNRPALRIERATAGPHGSRRRGPGHRIGRERRRPRLRGHLEPVRCVAGPRRADRGELLSIVLTRDVSRALSIRVRARQRRRTPDPQRQHGPPDTTLARAGPLCRLIASRPPRFLQWSSRSRAEHARVVVRRGGAEPSSARDARVAPPAMASARQWCPPRSGDQTLRRTRSSNRSPRRRPRGAARSSGMARGLAPGSGGRDPNGEPLRSSSTPARGRRRMEVRSARPRPTPIRGSARSRMGVPPRVTAAIMAVAVARASTRRSPEPFTWTLSAPGVALERRRAGPVRVAGRAAIPAAARASTRDRRGDGPGPRRALTDDDTLSFSARLDGVTPGEHSVRCARWTGRHTASLAARVTVRARADSGVTERRTSGPSRSDET